MPRKVKAARNKFLSTGVAAFSRSAMYHKTGAWAVKNKKATTKKKTEEPRPIVKKFGKKGESRTVLPKGQRWYPTDETPKIEKKKRVTTTTLRPSITPGVVLILLAGRFRGKRVVFLKQLDSGLLLITGPFKVNGVPLRRVNQAYVIATSTKVDISGVKVDPKINDNYFARPKEQKKKTESDFFAKDQTKKTLSESNPSRIEDQKNVDKAIIASLKKVPLLPEYLGTRFSLSKGQHPHLLKF